MRLFPTKDTVIAQTFRWLADLDDPTTPKRTFMDVYHAYSTRERRDSRSSFQNNIGRYTRGDDAVLAEEAGEVIYKKNGKPSMVTKWVWEKPYVNGQGQTVRNNREVTEERRVEMVRWIGPSPLASLSGMKPADLDRAYQLLERRLTEKPEPTVITLRSSYRHFRGRSPDVLVIDELGLTTRWLQRVKAAIDGTLVTPLATSRTKTMHGPCPVCGRTMEIGTEDISERICDLCVADSADEARWEAMVS